MQAFQNVSLLRLGFASRKLATLLISQFPCPACGSAVDWVTGKPLLGFGLKAV